MKEQVDTRVAAAIEKKGILIVFTGNGKGKSTAAFGTVTHTVGHGQNGGGCAVHQGAMGQRRIQPSPAAEDQFHIMGTGFYLGDSQNRQADIDAAKIIKNKRMLADKRYELSGA
ncbi:cob(I)yrinic acid a,c-diamide adenosyltransferase [Escherichia coli]